MIHNHTQLTCFFTSKQLLDLGVTSYMFYRKLFQSILEIVFELERRGKPDVLLFSMNETNIKQNTHAQELSNFILHLSAYFNQATLTSSRQAGI